MDEKVLEEIGFHQETIRGDDQSPLHLIREKEMEISGRVLAAKNEAERLVTEARRKAGELIRTAESEGDALAKQADQRAHAEAQAEAERLRASVTGEASQLEGLIAERMERAVSAIVGMVTKV